MSVDMMTPAQTARCHGEIVKWGKSYREEAIYGHENEMYIVGVNLKEVECL